MKCSKHQRSKQRCQDLCWKVHNSAQSFVLLSYTIHGYITSKFPLVSSSVWGKQLLCFVHHQGQKREQKHTTKNFVEFDDHSPLLTIARTSLKGTVLGQFQFSYPRTFLYPGLVGLLRYNIY